MSDDQPIVNLARMLRIATGVCLRRRYQVYDPEYGSAINEAVAEAATAWNPAMNCTPNALAIRYSLKACATLARRERRRADVETTAARPEAVQPVPPQDYPSLSAVDRELLAFVARWGHTSAARQLGMHPALLAERLDMIQVKMRQDSV